LKTVKYKGSEVHVGCEGVVVRGVCLKCGERKPSRMKRIFGEDPAIVPNAKFDEKKYRRRIREMNDLK